MVRLFHPSPGWIINGSRQRGHSERGKADRAQTKKKKKTKNSKEDGLDSERAWNYISCAHRVTGRCQVLVPASRDGAQARLSAEQILFTRQMRGIAAGCPARTRVGLRERKQAALQQQSSRFLQLDKWTIESGGRRTRQKNTHTNGPRGKHCCHYYC